MATDPNNLKDLVVFMAQSLVDFPEQVEVTEMVGEQTTVVELKVAKEDLGKVIGKQGRTVRALRSLVHAVGYKTDRRFVLDIVE